MPETALITGASSGIGRELAIIHAERGGDLIAVARRVEKLNDLRDELQAKHSVTVHVITKDLTEENAPAELHREIQERGLTVDYLVNNAGFGGQGKFVDRAWRDDRSMVQLNVIALAHLTRLFLPDMIARGSGRVLNVSSTAGYMPGPLQATYFATKAFVNSFSNALAEELRGTGVTVSALQPGATKTEFAERAGLESSDLMKQAVSARKVALDGYEGMLAGQMDIISGLPGGRFTVGLSRLLPKSLLMKQVRKMQDV